MPDDDRYTGSDASASPSGDGPSAPTRCGDGIRVEGSEACDDGNVLDGDGCTKACAVEEGYRCPAPGIPCIADACGDGVIAGTGPSAETCEDGNVVDGDGCSSACQIEDGYVCAEQGCHETVCGDGIVEGAESCDDHNDDPFDACADCQLRAKCAVGPCEVVCGDGMIFPEEACDDGNAIDGDGCSSTCAVEEGYVCEASGELGEVLQVPAVFRDFIMKPSASALGLAHPDFSDTIGSRAVSRGMVADTLDADGNPVYTGICEKGAVDATACSHEGANGWQTHGAELWKQWYQGGQLASEMVSKLTLWRATSGTYSFSPADFFPLDQAGWVLSGEELPDPGCTGGHNFGFTSEVRDWFVFRGGETLTFSGDDDVWVFIGGKLALDLGGVHSLLGATITLDAGGNVTCTALNPGACVQPSRALGLQVGKVYEIALFHAERRGCGSNFRLDLAGFQRSKSTCSEVCGDGITTRSEECDDGNNKDDDDCTNACKFNVSPD